MVSSIAYYDEDRELDRVYNREHHPHYRFIQGDCIEEINKLLPHEKFDMVLTDPVYNIGWKYSEKVDDKKKDYNEWCLEWAELCIGRLKENGILAIINYPENNNILYTDLVRKGYNFVQQLIWEYPTNVGQSTKMYTRNFRTIIIFSKSKEYTFNPGKQKYKNPTDKRIAARIAQGFAPTHYATFEINMCKNVSKDKKNNGINQLPAELVEMLIKTYTNEDDIILDPFVGNRTVMDIAQKLDRHSVGIDLNDYTTLNLNKEKSE
jgi:site-specific DNA-methyltransferase (adenine-specific)